jgi:hypothetical protein
MKTSQWMMRVALGLCSVAVFAHVQAQTLDESLLDQASKDDPRIRLRVDVEEPGDWCLWMDFNGGTLEQFQGSTSNNVRAVATLGHPEWSNNELTNAMSRMSSGFNSAVEWQGWYIPRMMRIGASRRVWKDVSAGIQLGRGWSPAYVNCTRADGSAVVSSWTQVRFADFLDQYLYYNDLHNGNLWQFQNNGVFQDGLYGWQVEFVAQQELAFGLGWTASAGKTLGLQQDLDAQAAGLFGSQGLLDPDELGATLSPESIAASPTMASFGITYRMGSVVTGLSWSSLSVNHSSRNDWVSAGATPIEPLRQMRLRLGLTF